MRTSSSLSDIFFSLQRSKSFSSVNALPFSSTNSRLAIVPLSFPDQVTRLIISEILGAKLLVHLSFGSIKDSVVAKHLASISDQSNFAVKVWSSSIGVFLFNKEVSHPVNSLPRSGLIWCLSDIFSPAFNRSGTDNKPNLRPFIT